MGNVRLTSKAVWLLVGLFTLYASIGALQLLRFGRRQQRLLDSACMTDHQIPVDARLVPLSLFSVGLAAVIVLLLSAGLLLRLI